MAVRSGRVGFPRDAQDEGHCDLQSEQSDRRGDGRGAAEGGPGRGPGPRRMAALDEVYIGAEREGPRTESVWGEYERTLIVNGLSKAYALPGLRIGWIVGPPETVATLWAHHDYTTLAPTYLSDRLAQIALVPKRREEILARTRSILQRNYGILADWIRDHGSLFSHIPPTAGAICFLRYALRINSTELAWRLLKEKSTLIVPGDHFGMDGFMRIGMGDAQAYLTKGLERIDALIREIRTEKGKS